MIILNEQEMWRCVSLDEIMGGIERAYAHAWEVGYRAVEVPRADGSWEAMPLR